jgi:chromosome segregation ATPase
LKLLESLKMDVESYKKKLSEEAYRMEGYQKKVDVLDSLYKKMKEKKEDMESLQKSLKSFANETYEYWLGNVFNNRYEKNVREELLINGYGKMMTMIDDNLDEINNKRTYYENLIYESKGIIGNVQSCINSVATHIENWVN